MNQKLNDVILGVDTHLDVHVGAVINCSGSLQSVGIEGTGTYGAALCYFLTDKSIKVIEVNRPNRVVRRLQGKSDPLDAENAARSVLAGTSTALPKSKNGASEAIRALLVSAPQDIRDRLWQVKPHDCAATCLQAKVNSESIACQSLILTIKLLAKRWTVLAAELKLLDQELDRLTKAYCARLRNRMGVGPYCAAILVTAAGDNPDRLKSEASLAALCGGSPLPASSGKTVRHQLNRGQSNSK
jgi:transposase